MSVEREESDDLYNEQHRNQLEETYNINLNIQTEIGEKTYWDLRQYFTKEIEQDNLLISTDWVTQCCHRTDIESIKEEFKKQLNELTKYESNELCEDTNVELLESAIGHSCQYAVNTNDNLETSPPPYN